MNHKRQFHLFHFVLIPYRISSTECRAVELIFLLHFPVIFCVFIVACKRWDVL